MRRSRADLRHILARAGAKPVPRPDPAFVASLEHHLVGMWERTGATRRAGTRALSRADLRRLMVAVGSVETPAPTPAFVDAVEEGMLRGWAPTSRRRVAAARPSRTRRVAIASAVAAAAAVAASAFVVLPHEGSPAVQSVRIGDEKAKPVKGDGDYRVDDKAPDQELVFTFEDGRTLRSKEGEFRVRDGNLYVPAEDGDGYEVAVPDEQLVAGPPPSAADEPAAVSSVELAPVTTTTTTTTTSPPSTEPPPTTTPPPPEAPPAP